MRKVTLELNAVALTFAILTVITVALRVYTRKSIKGLSYDDILIVPGAIFALATQISVMILARRGLGLHDDAFVAEGYNSANLTKAVFALQLVYCTALIFVKSSICMALIRLATNRRLLHVLYAVLGLSIIYPFISIVTIFAECQPVRALWDPSAGHCAKANVIYDIAIFITACSIVTDTACSILPFVILWKLQMGRRLKYTVAALLSLGFLASAAAIIRIPSLSAYLATTDAAYKLQPLFLWTSVEIGTAVVVASIPALKPLVRSIPFFRSQSNRTSLPGNTASYSLKPVGPRGNNSTHITGKAAREHDLDDSDSMKEILKDDRVVVSSEIRIENVPHRTGYESDSQSKLSV